MLFRSVISGASEAGVFYGIQTLRKSIPVVENSTPVLAEVTISDAPRFDYRGAHFDVSRHFFTVDEVKSFIDMMALHNMNRLHWHITDDQGWRIEIKKRPGLTEIGSKRSGTCIGERDLGGLPDDVKESLDLLQSIDYSELDVLVQFTLWFVNRFFVFGGANFGWWQFSLNVDFYAQKRPGATIDPTSSRCDSKDLGKSDANS